MTDMLASLMASWELLSSSKLTRKGSNRSTLDSRLSAKVTRDYCGRGTQFSFRGIVLPSNGSSRKNMPAMSSTSSLVPNAACSTRSAAIIASLNCSGMTDCGACRIDSRSSGIHFSVVTDILFDD
ncbi:hypothetical protein CHS0354_009328 [Potamilus streckersoni]|uniref:Uncharacterized protein n=1 Tax=Potamilus streckersoni TaxID=2493646 RepID=A0AAE0SN68_9BIVA|nr:hypothetical protein CHS0354_009328 [Potamilus streckersoni]